MKSFETKDGRVYAVGHITSIGPVPKEGRGLVITFSNGENLTVYESNLPEKFSSLVEFRKAIIKSL